MTSEGAAFTIVFARVGLLGGTQTVVVLVAAFHRAIGIGRPPAGGFAAVPVAAGPALIASADRWIRRIAARVSRTTGGAAGIAASAAAHAILAVGRGAVLTAAATMVVVALRIHALVIAECLSVRTYAVPFYAARAALALPIATAAVTPIRFRVDAALTTLSLTVFAAAAAGPARRFSLALLVAATAMLIVVALGVYAVAAAVFLFGRASAFAILANPSAFAPVATRTAVVGIVPADVHAAAIAFALSVGTRAAPFAA